MTSTEELRKYLDQGKLIIGLRESRDALSKGDAVKIIMAANAPDLDAESVRAHAKTVSVPVEVSSARNDQLGTICRKPFPIAFLAVKK